MANLMLVSKQQISSNLDMLVRHMLVTSWQKQALSIYIVLCAKSSFY